MATVHRKGKRNTTHCVDKVLAILRLFVTNHFGLTIEELMQESGLTRRTIYRYLGSIGDAGFGIYKERDPRTVKRRFRWRLRGSLLLARFMTVSA